MNLFYIHNKEYCDNRNNNILNVSKYEIFKIFRKLNLFILFNYYTKINLVCLFSSKFLLSNLLFYVQKYLLLIIYKISYKIKLKLLNL